MAKKVLIVVGIPNFDYSNEKSAVSSFLVEIKLAFEKKGIDVHFPKNSSKIVTLTSEEVKQNGIKGLFKSLIKRWPWFYYTLANRIYFTKQDGLIDEFSSKDNFTHIVEFHTAGSTFGIELAKLFNAKLSVIFDSPVDEQFLKMYGTKTLYWNRIKQSEKLTLESADNLMVYSKACEDFIVTKYNIDSAINILPCVINKVPIKNEPGLTFKIGFIGSFLSWHKVDMLVKAFQIFNAKISENSKLYLIGYGEEWTKIKTMVKESGLEKTIVLPGFVSEEELNQYKKDFSIAIMPGSNWYGSPLKLFEYAQCGIPFIAPETKTVKSIFRNKEHCLFVDSADELNSLVEHITFLYENKMERLEMGCRAREYYESNYSGDFYLKKLYQSLS